MNKNIPNIMHVTTANDIIAQLIDDDDAGFSLLSNLIVSQIV